MDKHLHIITHEIPWPVRHGGLVDLFYKIKALHEQGVIIHLHCYTSTTDTERELNKYCADVYYYQRKKGLAGMSAGMPYMVSSRNDPALLKNLLKDDHPILMEGIHCTHLLYSNSLAGRKILVRLHNVEHSYYLQLAKLETHLFRKIYYQTESLLLKRYERSIAKKAILLAVSTDDMIVFKNKFNAGEVHFIPVFLPFTAVQQYTGKGCFCLYHGNLSINENEQAAKWLLKEVFAKLDIPFVIAGRNPSTALQNLAHSNTHTCIVVNPAEAEMQDLIKKAQVHVLPSFNNTGVKLKLLNALYNGRFCLANKAAVQGSGIETLCTIAETTETFRQELRRLYDSNFSSEEIEARQLLLQNLYNNSKNAIQLMSWIY